MEKSKEDLEQEQLDVLLKNGYPFTVDLVFGIKWECKIRHSYLGTIDHLTQHFIKMDFNEAMLSVDTNNEVKYMAYRNSKRCAKIIALATLNSYFKIKFFSWIFSKIILWGVSSDKLFELSTVITEQSNFANFIRSIRLLNLVPRITSPNRIEEKLAD